MPRRGASRRCPRPLASAGTTSAARRPFRGFPMMRIKSRCPTSPHAAVRCPIEPSEVTVALSCRSGAGARRLRRSGGVLGQTAGVSRRLRPDAWNIDAMLRGGTWGASSAALSMPRAARWNGRVAICGRLGRCHGLRGGRGACRGCGLQVLDGRLGTSMPRAGVEAAGRCSRGAGVETRRPDGEVCRLASPPVGELRRVAVRALEATSARDHVASPPLPCRAA